MLMISAYCADYSGTPMRSEGREEKAKRRSAGILEEKKTLQSAESEDLGLKAAGARVTGAGVPRRRGARTYLDLV